MTEKPSYNPGEQVNGFIYLTLASDFATQGLFLDLVGQERVKIVHHYTTHSGSGKHRRTHHHYVDKIQNNALLNYRFPVHATANTLKAGQYSFPFSF